MLFWDAKVTMTFLIFMMLDIDLLITWGATFKKVKANEIIFKEGSQCNFYHQLVEGSVKWVNINEDGKEFLQTLIDPGESFGEIPLFDGEPYAATAIAVEDSLIIRLHQASFHQLIAESPNLHFKFSKLLCNRLRFKFHLLKEVAYHDPEKIIKALINFLKKNHKNICEKCNLVKLTRQQIADMTGLRVETVIRAMRHMHEKGDVRIERGKVFLNNLQAVIE